MTLKALLKKLQKLTPEQLKGPAKLYEGCSGNWTTIQGVEVAKSDEYPERDFMDSCNSSEGYFSPSTPMVKKGQVYFCHDH